MLSLCVAAYVIQATAQIIAAILSGLWAIVINAIILYYLLE